MHELPILPYAYNELQPHIDAETMEIHYSKHHKAYVENLNRALSGTRWEELTIEKLMKEVSKCPVAIRNNGGGHYNHSFFWKLLAPGTSEPFNPQSKIAAVIEKEFGSLEEFKTKFAAAATGRFGSGWVWLIVADRDNRLTITSTPNQDNPQMDLAEIISGVPIIGLDVWEHAYYLKYQNKRPDYVTAFWNILNWDKAEENYLSAT